MLIINFKTLLKKIFEGWAEYNPMVECLPGTHEDQFKSQLPQPKNKQTTGEKNAYILN